MTWQYKTTKTRQQTQYLRQTRKGQRHKTWDKQDKKEIIFKMLKRLLPEMNKPEQL